VAVFGRFGSLEIFTGRSEGQKSEEDVGFALPPSRGPELRAGGAANDKSSVLLIFL
jgi:hypothetical protein